MQNILEELAVLVNYKKRVQETTKRAVNDISTLTKTNNNLSRRQNLFQNNADRKKQTIQRNYEKQLLKVDAEFQAKIQTINKQIEDNKNTISALYRDIEELNGEIGVVSSVSAVEPTSNTKETKTRKKSVRIKSKLTNDMIDDVIMELVNKEEKGAMYNAVVMNEILKRYGNIISHEERVGGSRSRLYARVYARLGKLRKDGKLFRGTGDGIIVRKVSTLEPLTETN